MLDAIYTISETLKKDFDSRVQRTERSLCNCKTIRNTLGVEFFSSLPFHHNIKKPLPVKHYHYLRQKAQPSPCLHSLCHCFLQLQRQLVYLLIALHNPYLTNKCRLLSQFRLYSENTGCKVLPSRGFPSTNQSNTTSDSSAINL